MNMEDYNKAREHLSSASGYIANLANANPSFIVFDDLYKEVRQAYDMLGTLGRLEASKELGG